MTDQKKTLIAFLVDRSGSMASIKEDTEGGYRTFLEEQEASLAPGEEVECWLAQFDNEYERVYTNATLEDAKGYRLVPRGATALVDSFHRLIKEVGEDLSKRPEEERPGTVLFITLTDGMENASREVTAEQLRELIKKQEEEYSWTFVFLGANIDAVSVGGNFGIRAANAMTYGANAAGVTASWNAVSNYTQAIRSAAPAQRAAVQFSDEDRDAALGKPQDYSTGGPGQGKSAGKPNETKQEDK